MQTEQVDQLATALAAAQGMMKAATYNRINPHFKNKYADLAAVWDAIREPLSKSGLSITQTMERVLVGDAQGTDLFLVTTMRHKSGQSVSSYYPLPNGVAPQAFGSALTYARRYSLSAIVGIASDEDDDANEAQNTAKIASDHPHSTRGNLVYGNPPKALSDPQKEAIKELATQLDSAKLQRFLNWLSVKSLDDIRAHQYERAMAGLRTAIGDTGDRGSEAASGAAETGTS